MIKIFKKPIFYLTIIGIVFFFIYSAPRMQKPLINFSPDENANYFFSRLYTEKGTLMEYEFLNEGIDPIVHQRSINVNKENYLVPGSFLGMILFCGMIAKVLGSWAIIYITPFFAVLGVLFFYGILKRIFSWETAFIASAITFSHPALWYYSTRSMFHNVLFVSFLLAGIYFLIESMAQGKADNRNKAIVEKVFAGFSGLFLGLAIITRSVEAVWIGGVLLVMAIFYFKKIKLVNVFIILGIIFLTGLPILRYNQILYNIPFVTGYANLKKYDNENYLVMDSVREKYSAIAAKEELTKTALAVKEKEPKLEQKAVELNFSAKVKKLIKDNLPVNFSINFDFETANKNFKVYFIEFFNFLSTLFFISFSFFILLQLSKLIMSVYKKIRLVIKKWGIKKREQCPQIKVEENNKNLKEAKRMEKHQIAYAIIFLSVSFYLVLYYGSWIFCDAPEPNMLTMGTSYFRYWLPVYMMSMPFIAFFFVKISKIFKYRFPQFVFLFIVCLVITLQNALTILYAPHEGLLKHMSGIDEYNYKKQQVLKLTEDDSLIINQYYDKIFFPERKVIASRMYDDKAILENLPVLVSRAPVYYYSFGLAEKDIAYINKKHLSSQGVELIGGESIYKDERLWKFVKKK